MRYFGASCHPARYPICTFAVVAFFVLDTQTFLPFDISSSNLRTHTSIKMGFMTISRSLPQSHQHRWSWRKLSLQVLEAPSIAAPSRPVLSPSAVLPVSYQVDDISHQVMLNRLYQREVSQLWIHDLSGHAEGPLANSEFAHAMKKLTVQGSVEFHPRQELSCYRCRLSQLSNLKSLNRFDWSSDVINFPFLNGLRIGILPGIKDIYRARRHQ
jgi:hypothetical protein